MADGVSLIDLGKLSEPAKVLIEKVSDAVGGIAKPWQIVRVAKAEAQAEVIRAENRLEISDIERRALERVVREEGKRQENIEQITAGAIPHVKDDAKPQEIDEDWLAHFFDRSRLVSDRQMQVLWSKILAGKANDPSGFSKRTVDLISGLERADAELFSSLCSFVWTIGDLTPVIFNVDHDLIKEAGLSFDRLNHLDDIGLISFQPLTGFRKVGSAETLMVAYYGTTLILTVKMANDKRFYVDNGAVLLTQAGKELAPIAGAMGSERYFEYVLGEWLKQDIILASPIRRPQAKRT
ncbi:MAG: DUF2806 domain-containing protein [Rhizobiaceae bacterium]